MLLGEVLTTPSSIRSGERGRDRREGKGREENGREGHGRGREQEGLVLKWHFLKMATPSLS